MFKFSGLPLVLISIWAAIMEIYHPVPCWKNYGDLDYCWIIVGPMLFVLLVSEIVSSSLSFTPVTYLDLINFGGNITHNLPANSSM